MKRMKKLDYLSLQIDWSKTGDAEFPFHATYEGKDIFVRLNDFPSEHLYSLIINETAVDFDDWPAAWKKIAKPAQRGNRGLKSTDASKPFAVAAAGTASATFQSPRRLTKGVLKLKTKAF